ncbi:hypothetical protein LCGC14_3129660, partial [marine sediment metagenome]
KGKRDRAREGILRQPEHEQGELGISDEGLPEGCA